jgi:hypothetical protein
VFFTIPGSKHRRVTAEAARSHDVIHVQWAQTAALAASSKVDAPVVVTLHGSDVGLAERGGMWRRLLLRGLLLAPLGVVATAGRSERDHDQSSPHAACLTRKAV